MSSELNIEKTLLSNSPFNFHRAPAEIYDFEILASVGRSLRGGNGESASLRDAGCIKDACSDEQNPVAGIGAEGLKIVNQLEKPLPFQPLQVNGLGRDGSFR